MIHETRSIMTLANRTCDFIQSIRLNGHFLVKDVIGPSFRTPKNDPPTIKLGGYPPTPHPAKFWVSRKNPPNRAKSKMSKKVENPAGQTCPCFFTMAKTA